jgi:formamidopyrimidine-DNA glycosylase
MPELPEVEVFRRSLIRDGLVGSRIEGVDVVRPSTVKEPSPEMLADRLRGLVVRDVSRRGKFLVVDVREGSLVFHMGMTGTPRIELASEAPSPYTRVAIRLDDGRELRFIDPRVFGSIRLVADTRDLLANLGPEPLAEDLAPNPEFGVRFLEERLKNRRTPAKALLLDQGIAAGVGNIYADESLFVARLHPGRPAGSLDRDEIRKLREAIVSSLAYAIRSLDAMGPLGVFVAPPTEGFKEALEFLKVPRNDGSACTACGTPIQRIVIVGRGTYSCPSCQVQTP